MTTPTTPVAALRTETEVPYRLEPFGGIGWSVAYFASTEDAAHFVATNSDAAMPCWRRWDIINGQLILAR